MGSVPRCVNVLKLRTCDGSLGTVSIFSLTKSTNMIIYKQLAIIKDRTVYTSHFRGDSHDFQNIHIERRQFMIIYILLLILAYFMSSICFGSWTTRKMIPKQKGEWTDERISEAMKKNGITLAVMLILIIASGLIGWYLKAAYFLLFV